MAKKVYRKNGVDYVVDEKTANLPKNEVQAFQNVQTAKKQAAETLAGFPNEPQQIIPISPGKVQPPTNQTSPQNQQPKSNVPQPNTPTQTAGNIPTFEQIQKTASQNLPLTPEQQVDPNRLIDQFPTPTTQEEYQQQVNANIATFGKAVAQQTISFAAPIRILFNQLTGLGSRDTPAVNSARNNFKDINSYLDQSINNVAAGTDAGDTLQLIQEAETALQTMEAQVKGKGLSNLNYWLVGGREVEAEVAINRRMLQDKYVKLQAALLANQQNNARRASLQSQLNGYPQ